jgi:valyl-tRNA synthetase
MDEGLSRAVVKVFVALHKEGLIYKDKRLVNWDPKLLTAVSDLEVLAVETKGHLWYFRYPVEGLVDRFITVATTRPETMLGDSAVAVHPEDARYTDLVGCHVRLPLVGRRIPIIADPYSDPEKGTGAVKITPAHDFNDFEVGRRHRLPMINIFDAEAKLALLGNEAFLKDAENVQPDVLALDGTERFAARRAIVALMEAGGFLERIEPHALTVPHGDRSNAVIEPWLTDQWYVDAATLAQPALAAVRSGATTFHPRNWEKTYFDWLENIQPWCISRQLWWGHRIPAWYGPDGQVFVEKTEAEAQDAAHAAYGAKVALRRDEDVLDTWFSSGLWPFSTLGWPDATAELARYYPTSTLVTGFDIIFFWVARMMMMGLRFTGEAPFKNVYIHALVRDEKGAKMSKSKGNVVDPLQLIDSYGADALRFTLAAMAAQGRDIKLSTARIEGYRNFATKLWNAARFLHINGCRRRADFAPAECRQILNRWILGEARKATAEVTAALEAFRFNDAAAAAYRFVRDIFCDWFIELAKPVLQGPANAGRAETRACAAFVVDDMLKLLHPFMPFITEALWGFGTNEAAAEAEAAEAPPPPRATVLALSAWPDAGDFDAPEAEAEIGWVIDLVSEVRSFRSEMNVAAGLPLALAFVDAGAVIEARVERHADVIMRLARISGLDFVARPAAQSAEIVVRGTIVAIPLAGIVDIAAEQLRLSKERAKVAADADKITAKLANAEFVRNAPEEIVEQNKERLGDCQLRLDVIAKALERLDRMATAGAASGV